MNLGLVKDASVRDALHEFFGDEVEHLFCEKGWAYTRRHRVVQEGRVTSINLNHSLFVLNLLEWWEGGQARLDLVLYASVDFELQERDRHPLRDHDQEMDILLWINEMVFRIEEAQASTP